MKTGVFHSENDAVLFAIAKVVYDIQAPVGAWVLKEKLEECGINYGTATVGRYLKELDSRGMTVQKSNQGRILTEKGRQWVEETSDKVDRAQLRNEASKAMRANNYIDLIDLLRARKAIEMEAVKLAVQNASKSDLDKLHQAVVLHYRYVAENADPTEPALAFHSVLVEISHNRFMKSMFELLLVEERKIENSMVELRTRERGDSYVVEHDDIARAITERNMETASELMDKHLEALLHAVQEQIEQMNDKQ